MVQQALSLAFTVAAILSAIGYLLLAAWMVIQFITYQVDQLEGSPLADHMQTIGVTPHRYAWVLVRVAVGGLVALATILGVGLYLLTTADIPIALRDTLGALYLALTGVVWWLFADPLWLSFQLLLSVSRDVVGVAEAPTKTAAEKLAAESAAPSGSETSDADS